MESPRETEPAVSSGSSKPFTNVGGSLTFFFGHYGTDGPRRFMFSFVNGRLRSRPCLLASTRPHAEALLADPSPKVRRAVAGLLGAIEGQDGPVAERLLQARLEVEEHRQVRADLYLALGSLGGL
jgi:hypothetical protein